MSLLGEEQKALSQNLANRVDRPGQPGALGCDDERALDKNRVLDHRVEQFVVAGLGEVQLVVQRLPLADGLADVNPASLIIFASSERDGGVLRYWTTSGSMPLSRNKSRVLREVLQRGLW